MDNGFYLVENRDTDNGVIESASVIRYDMPRYLRYFKSVVLDDKSTIVKIEQNTLRS